jgi:TPP-dependent pyruvate/acetoin dehydrogenase alpha subunit
MELKAFFYTQMYKIRRVEETLLNLFSEGQLSGTTHTCIGQEACAVGVINAIERDKDIVFSNHRAHGHYIAYCRELLGLFAELMGREIGVSGGIGGSQHLYKRNFYTNGIQGGIVPVATGMAFAEKVKKTDAITLVFMGDGTLGQGVVYESFNIASLWKLPIIFVVEANQYAQSTPTHLQHAGDIDRRAEPYNIKSASIDVTDVMKVHMLAKEIVELVRKDQIPFFLVLHTYRLAAHSKGDDLRSNEEIEIHRRQDPLIILRKELSDGCIDVTKMERDVDTEVARVLETVKNSPFMSTDEFCRHLGRHI